MLRRVRIRLPRRSNPRITRKVSTSHGILVLTQEAKANGMDGSIEKLCEFTPATIRGDGQTDPGAIVLGVDGGF